MEIKEIQNLIKFVAKSGAHEVKLETDDFKITIKTNADAPVTETQTTIQTVPGMVVQAPQQAVVWRGGFQGRHCRLKVPLRLASKAPRW